MTKASQLRDVAIKAVAAYCDGTGSAEQCREAAEAAVIGGANLSGANLRGAWLSGANLSGADLSGANLSGANLSGADLSGANLSGADLSGADLWDANLVGAYLGGAYLRGANLGGAYLRGANLGSANLGGANLSGADLRDATINWQSHDLASEILRRAAGEDTERRKIAGLVLVSRDWCWDRFLAQDDPQREWAVSVLREYVTSDDGAPAILKVKKARDE